MGRIIRATITPPLLFRSKQLCLSLLYLFTTLFLALYTSLYQKKCFFRSSPFDPIQEPLFSYPSSYGEHKYALPTHRSSCSSPVFFSEYGMALKEIKSLSKSSTESSSEILSYIQEKSESFGGNFSTQLRFSYFDHLNDSVQVPCGFLKEYPISNSDRIAMESCKGLVVVSAIFNDHDKIRQPKGLGSQTLYNACFFMFVDEITLKGLHSHQMISKKPASYNQIGVWRIVEVSSNQKSLYENPAMNGVIPKYLVHRLFPNSKFSIWIDAKMQLTVDPLLLIHSLIISQNMDMAISKHPYFVNTLEEAMATARWKKWSDVDALKMQMETYCELGLQPWSPQKLPYSRDVPDSALILRRHGVRSNLFSCLMYNELEAFNPRDQLAFAFVRDHMKPKLRLNMFDVEVFEKIVVEYRHNLKKVVEISGEKTKLKQTKRVTHDLFVNDSCCSKCQNYLSRMWDESKD